MTQQIDDLFATRGKTTYRTTEGFAECTGDDFHFATEVIEFGYTVSGLTDYAGRVAFVHHDESVVFLCQFVNLIQRTYIAVHREDTVGRNDTETLCLCLLQFGFEVRHIAIRIAITDCLTQAYAVNDRGMVQRIGDDGIFFGQQRFKQTTIGIKTCGIKDGIFGAEEIGDNPFELFVGILRTTDETYGRHTVPACIHTRFGGFNQFLIIGEAEVVIRTEVDHFLSAFYGDAGRLRRDDHAFVLIESCILDLLQGRLQVFLKRSIHDYFRYIVITLYRYIEVFLDDALLKHSRCHLHKAGDVCTLDIINSAVRLSSVTNALFVN